MIKRIIIIVVVLAAVGGGVAWYLMNEKAQPVAFRTSPVTKGDLVVTIAAAGTVEPQEVIDVGAQVAGRIVEFGKDVTGNTVDYRSAVDNGTILARIDDVLYRADVDQASASVKLAQAGVERAVADLEQMKAKLLQAERDWARAQKLKSSEALAQTTIDAYEAAWQTAKSNVAVDEAAIDQARASLAQAQSTLSRAQLNLGYCTIASPVKGVVIDRRVNIGQTVVSSLNAPSLFLIAKDLTKMEVWVAVNEADIGRIKAGQNVTFTVDAFPGQSFKGTVQLVRFNASMTQNVVTYPVEILIDNSDGKLLPYLTANAKFEVARADNSLRVPAGALRWKPTTEQIAPEDRQAYLDRQNAKGARTSSSGGSSANGGEHPGTIWVAGAQFVKPLRVTVGLSDGVNTVVRGEGLAEGMEVVTGVQSAAAAAAAAASGDTNPFMPKMPSRRGTSTGTGTGSGTGASGGGPPPPPGP